MVGWPLAFSLLRHLPDRGFAFIRPVGLLLTGYVLWVGGSFRLLQNNIGGILVAMVIVIAVGLIWRRGQRLAGKELSMPAWLRQEWRYALSVEVVFTLAFVAWAFFKAHNPNIETAGGEKWMEIAFINGTLRSDYFPPQDPWLSGFAISYYYFGYVLMAMVTQLTGLVSTVAFNLYVPTLFAMTLTAALGIGANLVGLYRRTVSRGQLAGDREQRVEGSQQLSVSSGQSADRKGQEVGSKDQFVGEGAAAAGEEEVREPGLRSAAIGTGLVAALFVGVLGHLEGLLEVLHKRGLLPAKFWIWLDIRDLKVPPVGPGDSWIPDRFIWWWRGSRVLTDYTLTGQEQEVIDEFPFFSFLLADVHPHVLALPFVLLVVALALNLPANRKGAGDSDQLGSRQGAGRREQGARTQSRAAGRAHRAGETETEAERQNLVDRGLEFLQDSWQGVLGATGGRLGFGLYAVCLGGLSFLNTWDFPIYLSIVGLSYMLWLSYRPQEGTSALSLGVAGTILLGLTGIIFYLPFYATFQSQASGILPNLWNPTRLPQFFVFFGIFLTATIGLLGVLSYRNRGWERHLSWSLPLTVLGPVLIMLVVLGGVLISPAGREYIRDILNNPEVQQVLGNTTISALMQESLLRRALNPWTFLLLGGMLGWVLALLVNRPVSLKSAGQPLDRPVIRFVLILLFVGLGLPLAVEFVYLRDNFGIRMNTIFKFYFQAWVLLALVSAFAVYYVSRNLRGVWLLGWQVIILLLVAAGMVYPVLATLDKTNYFNNEPTLSGIHWVAQQRPGDYAAIQWLRENAPDDAVILEAPADRYAAYQYTGRVSALTGLPTLLGWAGHQSQWRGNYDEPARREPDIEILFNTTDLRQTQQLLEEYGIDYVYIGPLEQERYSPQGLAKFGQLMEVVYQQEGVTIYRRA